jgi:Tfp pilus assembly protein FimT
MASRKISTHNRGVTLIEILVVMAMLIIIGGLSLFVSNETYRGNNFRTERDLFVSLLQHARAQAVNNVCVGNSCTDGQAHGVHIVVNASGHVQSFVNFQGTNYNATDTLNVVTDVAGHISQAISLSGARDFDFEQLSGDTTATSTILFDGVSTSTVTTQSEGQINWTN